MSLLITQLCLLAVIIFVGIALWEIHKTVLGMYSALRHASEAMDRILEHLQLK